MILDHINNISKYQGLYPSLDECIHFIQTHDLTKLPEGKTEISPTSFVSVFTYTIHPEDQRQYEAHHLRGDIHFTLSGSEIMDFCDTHAISIQQPYSIENDILLGQACSQCRYKVDSTHFAIVFPQDGHAVKGFDQHPDVRKIVFKFQL